MDDYHCILQYIKEVIGITISDSHKNSIYKYIQKTCHSKGLDLKGYFLLIKQDNLERNALINAVTVTETYFFREEKQFMVLKQHILPEYIQQKKSLRIWSATCASGEEAISLAILASRMRSHIHDFFYVVYASDINTGALEKFNHGIYGKNSFRTDGKSFYSHIQSGLDQQQDSWILKKSIRQNIKIIPLNIYLDNLDGIPGKMDIIFLRNTILYYCQNIKMQIILKIINKLAVNGYLFLGTSETAAITHKELKLQENEGVYYFKKIKTAAPEGRRC